MASLFAFLMLKIEQCCGSRGSKLLNLATSSNRQTTPALFLPSEPKARTQKSFKETPYQKLQVGWRLSSGPDSTNFFEVFKRSINSSFLPSVTKLSSANNSATVRLRAPPTLRYSPTLHCKRKWKLLKMKQMSSMDSAASTGGKQTLQRTLFAVYRRDSAKCFVQHCRKRNRSLSGS